MIDASVDHLVAAVNGKCGRRIVTCYLCGSRAHGTVSPESDRNQFVVFTGPATREEARRLLGLSTSSRRRSVRAWRRGRSRWPARAARASDLAQWPGPRSDGSHGLDIPAPCQSSRTKCRALVRVHARLCSERFAGNVATPPAMFAELPADVEERGDARGRISGERACAGTVAARGE